ncbi:MAG: DUF3347 domain-containing protein [Ferruginibacter sp.]
MKSKIHELKNTISISVRKKILFTVALIATVFVQQAFAQDSTKTSTLLTSYYAIKDALVSSNPDAGSASAAAFVKAANALAKEMVTPERRNALVSDATAISQTKDLKLQREKFATLSANLGELAKTVKLTTEPVYQQYCPMKKASWLSNNKAIKNPYYGSAMLTCGSVKATF